jgi:hypothetical protein
MQHAACLVLRCLLLSSAAEAFASNTSPFQLSACCCVLQEGIDKFFEAAQAATAAMEEATPLLEEAALLTKEITPLLQVSV